MHFDWDDNAILFDDPEHSEQEDRFFAFGHVRKGKGLHRMSLLSTVRYSNTHYFGKSGPWEGGRKIC